VALARANRHVRLVVSDDGVGLPAGLDVRASPSVGLQLVRMLAKQLDADFGVETGPGALFRLTVPLGESRHG
jgi:two-component sensor histidine kinase